MPTRAALDTIVGIHIARAGVVANEAFEVHIGKPHDLRKVDFSLLMLLAARESLAPKELIPLLSLSAPKLSMVLDRMQVRGLIERAPNPRDRRSVQVTLTPPGAQLARSLGPVARRMEQGLRKRLGAADHAELIRLLGKLADGPPPKARP